MKQRIYILSSLFLILSCQKNQNNIFEKNQIDLISDIINSQYALPPLPPLPNDTITSWEMTQKTIDSVKAVKLNVAIYPLFCKPRLDRGINLGQVDEEFKDLVKKFSDIEFSKKIPIKDIDDRSRHKVVLADTIVLKKSRDWKEYDLLLNISNISFNKNFDKAALDIGISRSALWGSGGLYLFKKDDENKWKIIKYFEFEEW
jgi:hypothetical protein